MKICTCAQSHALASRTNFQLEILNTMWFQAKGGYRGGELGASPKFFCIRGLNIYCIAIKKNEMYSQYSPPPTPHPAIEINTPCDLTPLPLFKFSRSISATPNFEFWIRPCRHCIFSPDYVGELAKRWWNIPWASATMILTKLNRDNSVPARWGSIAMYQRDS